MLIKMISTIGVLYPLMINDWNSLYHLFPNYLMKRRRLKRSNLKKRDKQKNNRCSKKIDKMI
jgi:hypothetical protein